MKLHEITKQRFLTDKAEIEAWLNEMEIENYTIHPGGVVDVNGDVNLSREKLTSIPVHFGKVSGYFDCGFNNLTSLVGCPRIVGDVFYGSSNNLTGLEGCPRIFGGDFYYKNNKLTSLEGISDLIEEMNGIFHCYDNEIERGGLGLLLIKGLTGINSYNPALDIIDKYVGKDDLFGCQEELMDNGFEEFAIL